jgi:hypothetical protein
VAPRFRPHRALKGDGLGRFAGEIPHHLPPDRRVGVELPPNDILSVSLPVGIGQLKAGTLPTPDCRRQLDWPETTCCLEGEVPDLVELKLPPMSASWHARRDLNLNARRQPGDMVAGGLRGTPQEHIDAVSKGTITVCAGRSRVGRTRVSSVSPRCARVMPTSGQLS